MGRTSLTTFSLSPLGLPSITFHYCYTAGSAPHITRQLYLFRHQQMNDAREYHLELVIL
jgi:hypothetical protein